MEAAKLFGLLLLLILTACSSQPINHGLLNPGNHRYAQLAPSHNIANLPYYPQIEDQCGPSSLATMLGVQGIVVSPEQLREKIYIPGKEGTVTTEMIARARRYGLLVYPLAPELLDVLAEINAGNPVLVMQNLGFNWLPRWHFSVAMAYDLKRQTISLRSGTELKHEIGFSLFAKTWRRANSWAVVLTQPDNLPATATAAAVVQAASQLEQVGELQAAYKVYQAVLTQWPQTTLAAFGAGNAAYALGHYGQAEQHFTDYIAQQPQAAQGWNNLAYTLIKRQCISAAKQAIHCAVQLQPSNKQLLESFDDINRYPAAAAEASCKLSPCVLP
ncbi:PA2778 family cysteine peptidase [Dasania marina]|uniref:PA2778 family cysteine peptidase n=1 Tax=Dasania marina TaxID=471499 RepID=UPI0030DACC16|tara:strand:+ start:40351 stop:41340 length:990 start_codon:yes stop_codon:yes gene_type:complete